MTRSETLVRLASWFRALCAVVMLLAGAALEAQPTSAAASSAYSETDIKAAFLYNFGSYVQWPKNAAASEPITIAVLNAAGVEEALERLVQGRALQNRPARGRRGAPRAPGAGQACAAPARPRAASALGRRARRRGAAGPRRRRELAAAAARSRRHRPDPDCHRRTGRARGRLDDQLPARRS